MLGSKFCGLIEVSYQGVGKIRIQSAWHFPVIFLNIPLPEVYF